MNTSKLMKSTQDMLSSTLEFTNTIVEKSKQARHPSKKANKIGSTIGISIGLSFIVIGTIGFILGKSVWPTGTFVAGVVTIASNSINLYRTRNHK